MNIAFFIRHFTERGTEVAIYDYAHYNETILNNKSYIICFNKAAQTRIGLQPERYSYDKFSQRFQIIEIDSMDDMPDIINRYNLSFFYTQTHGQLGDIYPFDNKALWGNCKTIKHCVFNTQGKEGDFYISISTALNEKNGTNIPVIPYIVCLPDCNEDLRHELNIPKDALVLGRYGGAEEFNIQMTHQAIAEYLAMDENAYFLFMNTNVFYEHPRIIYLQRNIDVIYKVKFINTCDAMIHARAMGETFGLSIAEFSINNKPIITCPCGDIEHIKILKDKAILYRSKDELINIFQRIRRFSADWNCYRQYTPENVMKLFKELIFAKKSIYYFSGVISQTTK
jgi:hypothetical protein